MVGRELAIAVMAKLREEGLLAYKENSSETAMGIEALTELFAPDPAIEPTFVTATNCVSPTTGRWLNEMIESRDSLIVYDKPEIGWWVRVPQDDTPEQLAQRYESVPDDLVTALRLAAAKGCSWVMFDMDADVADGLDAVDW